MVAAAPHQAVGIEASGGYERAVVAQFDGGTITSNAGALLLGQMSRGLELTRRFAQCFPESSAVVRQNRQGYEKSVLRPKSLEDHLVGEARCRGAVLRGAGGPGEQRQSDHEPRCPRRDRSEIVHPKGEEGGAAFPSVQEKCQFKALRRTEIAPNQRRTAASRRDTADDVRGNAPQGDDKRGVKRHNGDRPMIARKHGGGSRRKPKVAVEPALEFDDERRAPGHEVEQVSEGHHPVGGRTERHAFESRGGHIAERACAISQTAKRIVMINHGLVIGADLQVGLNAIVACYRRRRSRCGVFDDTLRAIMEPPMGDRAGGQPAEAWFRSQTASSSHSSCAVAHDTSNVPSTSTAASAGSTATPTVVRA